MDPINILIIGAGKIGQIIAHLLAQAKSYHILLADIDIQHINTQQLPKNITLTELDINKPESVKTLTKNRIDAIVSCLPYYLTKSVVDIALKSGAHYFDLTEDVEASKYIQKSAQSAAQAFVPHCGLAPGFINIVAHDLMQKFSKIQDVKLRCGALPQNTSNALQYALTWSTDGLINEYGNPCQSIKNGKVVITEALEDWEEVQIDGANYEAFNTSGGIATLIQSYLDKVENLNYKTIRYPGHCDRMRFLMDGLKLNNDRATLKKILENAIPTTHQDVVIVYVSVTGQINGEFTRQAFVKKYYPEKISGKECTAIQVTTASGASSVIDLVLSNPQKFHGFIRQEAFSLEQIFNNRYGKIFNQ